MAKELNQGCPREESGGLILEKVAAEGNTIVFYYDARSAQVQKAQFDYADSQSGSSLYLDIMADMGLIDVFADNDLSFKIVMKCSDGIFDKYIPCDEIKACCNSGSNESNSANAASYHMQRGESLEAYVDRLQSMLPVTDDNGYVIADVSLTGTGLFITYNSPTGDKQKVLEGDPSTFKIMFKSLFQYSYGELYETLKRENANVLILMGSHPIEYYPSMEN
ncbi:MAG: hypothetical protein MJZ66_01690 [Bacteroidales bacterium]|nr:hypothetical protein [Bacteroidales bacterium]